jgi:hypothetical protein
MTPLYPARASRVRKARWPSRCQLCRDLIRVGQQIGKTPVGWCHVACIINRAKKLETAR